MYKKVTQWVDRNSEGEQFLDPTFFTEKSLKKIKFKKYLLKFKYSEKATHFEEIEVISKLRVRFLQIFVAFSENLNFS